MAKFRVVVTETQSYEVYVEASTEQEAEKIALDSYGSDGEVFHTDSEVIDVEEEEL